MGDRPVNRISAQVVDNTWKEVGAMTPRQALKLAKQMQAQAPVLMVYLVACGGDMFNREERELLNYLGLVVWRIMSKGDSPLPEITPEKMEAADDANMNMVKYMEGEPPADLLKTIGKVLNNYNQPEVLKFVLEALMEPEEGSEVREEYTGMMFLYLKTVIDCLDR